MSQWIIESPKCKAGVKKQEHKIYREDSLSYWIEKKDQKPYLELLEDIAISLSAIFSEDDTYNPHDKLTNSIKEQTNEKQYHLFEKQVHALTLLNHPYRVLSNGYYVSSKEDVLLAARLIQPISLPKTLMRRQTKKTYLRLLEHFDYKPFTTRQASLALLMPVATVKNHVYALMNCGFIESAGGNRKDGFLYQIK